MNQPAHHQHPHDHGSGHHHPQHQRRGLHKDWRMWAIVLLMLGAMVIYVMTQDESLGPKGPQEKVPAAAE